MAKKNLPKNIFCASSEGFTLVELIVTIAVSSIFLVIVGTITISLITNYNNNNKNLARSNEIELVTKVIEGAINDINNNGYEFIESDETAIRWFYKSDSETNEILSFNSNVLTYKTLTYNFNYITDIDIIGNIGNNYIQVKISTDKYDDNKTYRLVFKIVA